jgi:hypothetical protein
MTANFHISTTIQHQTFAFYLMAYPYNLKKIKNINVYRRLKTGNEAVALSEPTNINPFGEIRKYLGVGSYTRRTACCPGRFSYIPHSFGHCPGRYITKPKPTFSRSMGVSLLRNSCWRNGLQRQEVGDFGDEN